MYTADASKKHGAQEVVYSEGVLPPMGQSVFRVGQIFDKRPSSPRPDVETGRGGPGDTTSNGHGSQHSKEEIEEEEEEPQLSLLGAFLLLGGITVITGVTAEFLVSFSRFGLRIWA